jgi:SAM-dependent methyltransferase
MTGCKGPVSPLASLEPWYRTPLGRAVAARESTCLVELLQDIFGYYLVQVGGGACFPEVMAASRIRHRVLLPTRASTRTRTLEAVGSAEALPLAADAVDALILPHTLDLAGDPRQVLREAERVLIPGGRVLILGFNALSGWGLLRFLYRYRRRIPWCGRFLTTYRVEDWLSLLGFEVEVRRFLVLRPPLGAAKGTRLVLLDVLGRALWPALGAVYVIRAVKRVMPLTPVRPSWMARPALLGAGAIEPSARNGLPGAQRGRAGTLERADV